MQAQRELAMQQKTGCQDPNGDEFSGSEPALTEQEPPGACQACPLQSTRIAQCYLYLSLCSSGVLPAPVGEKGEERN